MSLFGLKSHNQKGQATIEVILLGLVAVIVILGLVYRFNTAFRKYTVDLYGTYYRCLLETGELPGTRSVCRDRETRFNIANGSMLVRDGSSDPSGGGGGSGGSGSGSDGSGSGGGGSGSGSGGSSGRNNAGSGSSGSGGSGSGSAGGGSAGDGGGSETVGGGQSGGGRASAVSRLQRAVRQRSTSVGNAADVAPEDADAAARASEGGLIVDSTGARASVDDPLRRGRTKMDFKMEGDEYQREETKTSVPLSAAAPTSKKDSERGSTLRPRKAVENTDRTPAKAMEDRGGGLEFGRLFRMFLIFGIIAGIVVFLGGQVLQISKSGER